MTTKVFITNNTVYYHTVFHSTYQHYKINVQSTQHTHTKKIQ